MKIAITSEDNKTISGNADTCLNYFVFTVENERIVNKEPLKLVKGQELENIFINKVVEIFEHPLFDVDMILAEDISPLVTARLKERQTVAFVIEEKDIDDAIVQVIQGRLQGYVAEEHNCNCGSC